MPAIFSVDPPQSKSDVITDLKDLNFSKNMLRLTLALFAGFLVFWVFRVFGKRRRGATATRTAVSLPLASSRTGAQVAPSKSRSRPGRRTILAAAAGAFLSLFMNWLDFLWIERTGFGLGLAVLALVWVYPVATAICSWRIHAVFSKVCAAMSILMGLVVLAKANRKIFFFFDVDMAGLGIAVYLGCAVLFSLGVFRYAKAAPLARKAKI